jgi:hypothetical protein
LIHQGKRAFSSLPLAPSLLKFITMLVTEESPTMENWLASFAPVAAVALHISFTKLLVRTDPYLAECSKFFPQKTLGQYLKLAFQLSII